jgi:eukaryotic-like serine/threonine-protein kinase
MSDTASGIRAGQATPPSGEGEEVRAAGLSSARRVVRPEADQPTIITGRPPLNSPAASDSTCRILEGRVMPGDRLGHFELVEYVGGGGMGRVFQALDTQLGRPVALKVLPPEQASDPDALQRFQNEAQSSARLDHDNIARAYYSGEDRGLHFIVFEFVEGMNVRSLVERKGPLPLAEAVSYTLQVAEALAHADARAVVHRDIKPSNVLITPEGRVKLIDLGLARLRHADPATADLTASGVTLGTFDYISPEQARDPRNADIRSDIYSLGCTFFFMLAGQPPFPEGTVLQKLLQHQGDQPPDIQQFRPELPEESSRVLRKMMAKDPRHRYAAPADLVADLLMLAEQIGLRPMSPTSRIWLVPQEPSVSFVQRHLPWIAPVAALVCIVLLLDHFSAPRDEQLPPPSAEVADRTPKQPAAALPKVFPPRSDGVRGSGTSNASGTTKATPSGQTTAATTRAQEPGGGTAPSKDRGNSSDRGIAEQSGTAGLAFRGSRGGLSAAGPSHPPAPASQSSVPAEAGPKRSGLLIVSASPTGDDQFSTLAAACAAARNGDVIELRFDGPREDRPLKTSNLRVTIRAGEGRRPIVVFRPTDADPVKCPRSMLTLAGGQLTLIGVAAELHVPRGVPADNWSLFETRGDEMVRLDRCSLTVLNTSDQGSTYHQDVAFFRARSAPDADSAIDGFPSAPPPTTIELTDCIARGEADFLRVEDLQPVHMTWDNGLLLTTERLLAAEGGQVAPKLDEMLRIELRHVTAVARGGLCRLSSTSANPHQLAVQFVSTNSILMVSPDVPLITQEGIASVEDFRKRFIWDGQRNYYEDVDVFWMVRNLDPEVPPDVMNFEAWKAYWRASREDQPSTERLVWKKSADVDRPLHAQGPADYTLKDPTFGDASAGPPGCRVDRLPQLLPEAASHTLSRPGWLHGAGATRPSDEG